jgi:hypothetical protein
MEGINRLTKAAKAKRDIVPLEISLLYYLIAGKLQYSEEARMAFHGGLNWLEIYQKAP